MPLYYFKLQPAGATSALPNQHLDFDIPPNSFPLHMGGVKQAM
jgi:hypothetical protein